MIMCSIDWLQRGERVSTRRFGFPQIVGMEREKGEGEGALTPLACPRASRARWGRRRRRLTWMSTLLGAGMPMPSPMLVLREMRPRRRRCGHARLRGESVS